VRAQQAAGTRKVKIAGADTEGKDLTVVEGQSDFSLALEQVFRRFRPARILETGTYLGTGTTRTLASLIRDYRIEDASFYSLEVDPGHHRQARQNLQSAGLMPYVQPLLGLSVPRSMLPGYKEIEEALAANMAFGDVYVDHQEHERTRLYFEETNFEDVPDDFLNRCLKMYGYRPDLVLLDSGGHMGFVEFQYMLGLLEGPCTIALDDVFHVKHRRSLQCILDDPRFDLMFLSREKFGFCVARFDPGRVQAKPLDQRILWVRLDAIGDNLLAASMLEPLRSRYPDARIYALCQPHVAELYQACPFVDEVLTVDKARVREDASYLQEISREIARMGFDICLHSTYSREPLADVLAGASGALRRVAPFGDDHNRKPGDRPRFDAFYTDLVPAQEDLGLELDRHKAFLQYLGIQAGDLQPAVWVNEEDGQAVETLLREAGLQGRPLLALFPGAQWDARVFGGYAQALAPVLGDRPDLAVVALGTQAEHALSQGILDALPQGGLNLCGRVTLRQCAALLRRSVLGLGAETGLAHMACAVGTPNVVVLGGGHFARFMPYSPLTTCAVLPRPATCATGTVPMTGPTASRTCPPGWWSRPCGRPWPAPLPCRAWWPRMAGPGPGAVPKPSTWPPAWIPGR
jgi:ADP-heptose:LPS heptosyltransferase